MSEMVERVAKALCRQYEIDDGFSPEQADRHAESGMHQNFMKAARAAMAAMREPTPAMWKAEQPIWSLGRPMWDWWRAMIDEALK